MCPFTKLRILWTIEFQIVLAPSATYTSFIVFSVKDRVLSHFTRALALVLVANSPKHWHIGLPALIKLYQVAPCIFFELEAENLVDEVVIILGSFIGLRRV